MKYSNLIITDDNFDENMEKLADENGFPYVSYLDFVEKLPENLNFTKQDNENGYEEWISIKTIPNRSSRYVFYNQEQITAYEFANGFMLFGIRENWWQDEE